MNKIRTEIELRKLQKIFWDLLDQMMEETNGEKLLVLQEKFIVVGNQIDAINGCRQEPSLDWTRLIQTGIGVGALLMILRYEESNVITSKGFNTVMRMLGL